MNQEEILAAPLGSRFYRTSWDWNTSIPAYVQVEIERSRDRQDVLHEHVIMQAYNGHDCQVSLTPQDRQAQDWQPLPQDVVNEEIVTISMRIVTVARPWGITHVTGTQACTGEILRRQWYDSPKRAAMSIKQLVQCGN